MYVIFNKIDKVDRAMICFYDDFEKQARMMHRLDISEQVEQWQETNSGNPPKFYSRITIKEFTTRNLNFSNI